MGGRCLSVEGRDGHFPLLAGHDGSGRKAMGSALTQAPKEGSSSLHGLVWASGGWLLCRRGGGSAALL